MKTTVEIKLTSKNSGKTYNIIVDFLKNTYFCIELNESLNVNDLSTNFPEYYQNFHSRSVDFSYTSYFPFCF